MDKLDEVIENYMVDTQDSGCNREQTIRQLFELRKKTIRLIDNTTKTLEKRKNDLRAINETICDLHGHFYTDWVIHTCLEIDSKNDFYYTRTCMLCGKFERTENKPTSGKILKRTK